MAALQVLRGVAQMTAVTMVAETGSLSRFQHPRQLMSYSGLVSSEYSSGNHIQRGGIIETGNAPLRRVLVEAAWAYQHKPWVGGFLLKRQQGLDQKIKDIAWKAQWRCVPATKNSQPTVKLTSDRYCHCRELLGFAWAIAVETEPQPQRQAA